MEKHVTYRYNTKGQSHVFLVKKHDHKVIPCNYESIVFYGTVNGWSFYSIRTYKVPWIAEVCSIKSLILRRENIYSLVKSPGLSDPLVLLLNLVVIKIKRLSKLLWKKRGINGACERQSSMEKIIPQFVILWTREKR